MLANQTQRRSANSPVPRRDAWTVVTLALAPAVGLGIARFAYALVLPDMRADLGWSYAEAGWMNTSNAAGYLLGALLCTRAIAMAGAFRVMVIGVWACVLALVLCAVMQQFVALNIARGLAGVGGGLAFVAGGVLAAHIAHRNPEHGALYLGLFYAGPGLGIFLSGITVPMVLALFGAGSWRIAWVALTALSLVMSVLLMCGKVAEASTPETGKGRVDRQPFGLKMLWLLAGYLLFGAGYIAYMTFMIAWVRDGGGGAGFQAAFWAAIGAAAMTSPWVCARPLKQLQHGHAFALLVGVTAIGAALPLASGANIVLFLSAVIFGAAFFAVVASTTVFVRRNLPPAHWASAIGALTVAFGAGQMLGPVATGMITDHTGGLAGGLWASVLMLFAACISGLFQRDFAEDASGATRD
ncbi:YbfB/YjiJ family MFS transporter [Salipiger aestuarii]|nr:YbfB/YjiJ family MFS transporter [Salipiger aestuarii]